MLDWNLEPGSPDERLQVLTDCGCPNNRKSDPNRHARAEHSEAKEGTRCLVSASIKGRTKMSRAVRAAG